MRLLQAARLSRKGEASTGIDKQDETARRYAMVHEHEVVATAADTDVSGDTDPFTRPQLGPWLTKRSAEFDGVIASHLDRLGRNARYLTKLRDWAEDAGKKLIVVSPPLMWPPEPDDLASPIIWDVLGRLAEYELAAIKRRSNDTKNWLIRNEYLFGKPPFGYRITEKDEHKTLAPDPKHAPIVREMVSRYMAGETLTTICRWLDTKAKTSQGGYWNPGTVTQLLRNPSIAGRRKNAAGQTVLKFEPIIDLTTFNQLQRAIDGRAPKHGAAPPETAMLTNIAECWRCHGPMYQLVQRRNLKNGTRQTYVYYRCNGTPKKPSKCGNMVRADEVNDWLDDWFTSEPFGEHEIIERLTIPGNGHQAELDANAADIRDLDMDDPEYDRVHAQLRAERKRLQELPVEPDQVIERPTGVLLGNLWATLDTQAKRQHLIAAGVKVIVWRDDLTRRSLKGNPYAVIARAGGDVSGTWRRLTDADIARPI